MDKLKMMSKDKVQANIEKIKALFPNAVTEVLRDGKSTLAVDFDVLKQEMSDVLVDDKEERYQFTWPDKKKSILLANAPVSATLRPCKEESVNFDNTKNLYIEGDNLDVLKLLQETYLGKIKMIYIDPPYNTGNDFVYNDDFAESSDDYLASSGQYDEQGNRLVQNVESNGRFHTDWLNMIYPRLKIAKDLLADDGTIFISIDDNEVANLVKICDDIFGEFAYVACVPRLTSPQRSGQEDYMNVSHDYIVIYSYGTTFNNVIERDLLNVNIKHDKNGAYVEGDTKAILATESQGYSKGGDYDFEYNGKIYRPVNRNGKRNRWLWTYERMKKAAELGILVESGNSLRMQVYLDKKYEEKTNRLVEKDSRLIFHTNDLMDKRFSNPRGIADSQRLDMKGVFSAPKPVDLLKMLIDMASQQNAIILDFFSGSATTAHAVMQLNAEDGGNRRFIMVQLPEICDEKSEAYKAGYKNICEIGKERIRRAGAKIMQNAQGLDVGFRVLKLDSSNMKDVFYRPGDFNQDMLSMLESNIKEDRSALDLLFQVMLELGKPLSAKIEEKVIAGKHVFIVDENDLIACFDENITEEVVKTIAQIKPLYAVFRDNSFANDAVAANLDQIFATYSPNTTRKVL